MTGKPLFTVIERKPTWRIVNLAELSRYRDLLWFLSLRDVSVRYKQTVMGLGWAVIRPVVSTLLFSAIFGLLAKIPSDGVPYPLFALCAMIPWTYFSAAFTSSSQSLVTNANMIKKVYFPRAIIPLTPILGGLIDFAVALMILLIMMFYYGVAPNSGIVVLPFLVVLMMLTAAGIGFWLSALAVQYRDVNQALPFVGQILMYAAPVVWPVSMVVQQFPVHGQLVKGFYALYPMVGVIEGFRSALIGTGPMPWDLIAIGTGSSVFLCVGGLVYFHRLERSFADVA